MVWLVGGVPQDDPRPDQKVALNAPLGDGLHAVLAAWLDLETIPEQASQLCREAQVRLMHLVVELRGQSQNATTRYCRSFRIL